MQVLEKLKFIALCLLTDLQKDDERWQENVRGSGLQDGYTLAGEIDYVLQDFALGEMQAVTGVKVYDFVGGRYDTGERFYEKEEQVFLHTATGTLWLLWREDIDVV